MWVEILGIFPATLYHRSLTLEEYKQSQPAPYNRAQPVNDSITWLQQPL